MDESIEMANETEQNLARAREQNVRRTITFGTFALILIVSCIIAVLIIVVITLISTSDTEEISSRAGSILRVEKGDDKLHAPDSWNGTAFHGCFIIRNPHLNCSQAEQTDQNSTSTTPNLNVTTKPSQHYPNEIP